MFSISILEMDRGSLRKLEKEELIDLVKRQEATLKAYALHINRLEKTLLSIGGIVYTTNPKVKQKPTN